MKRLNVNTAFTLSLVHGHGINTDLTGVVDQARVDDLVMDLVILVRKHLPPEAQTGPINIYLKCRDLTYTLESDTPIEEGAL